MFLWSSSPKLLHSAVGESKMENYLIQRKILSNSGVGEGRTQIIRASKWLWKSGSPLLPSPKGSARQEEPGCIPTAVTWHRRRPWFVDPSFSLDAPCLPSLWCHLHPGLPHPRPPQLPAASSASSPSRLRALADCTHACLPWPRSLSPHPGPRFSGPTWTPCRTSLQRGGPVARAEDEEAVATASGYRGARGRQGRAELERREGGVGRQAGEAVGRCDRWGGRKKVFLRPPGPAEQVPPDRGEAGAFALPVHSQLGPSPHFLFLFPSAERRLPTPPRRPAAEGSGCAGALSGPADEWGPREVCGGLGAGGAGQRASRGRVKALQTGRGRFWAS